MNAGECYLKTVVTPQTNIVRIIADAKYKSAS